MAHLIFLTGTPPTIAGGSGTWVGISVLRDAIVALGHEVTLITPPPSRETMLSRLMFNLRAPSRLRGMKADALIGFDLDGTFVQSVRFFHVAAIKGVLADEALHERGFRRLSLAVQARLEARHVRRAARVITTSIYSSQRIAALYGTEPEKIFVVPELIDLEAWELSLQAAPAEEGSLRVLCVAHLYARKRVELLLRAFRKVQENAVLRIVGVGPERSRLEQLARQLAIADRVHFLGYLPFKALVAEYRNASVFALPSSQEGFGIVFLEAMASSLPVIAACAAAVPEVVAEGLTSWLVDPDDGAALAEALRKLLAEPETRLALGTAGRAHVRQFDAPTVARQFLAAAGIRSA